MTITAPETALTITVHVPFGLARRGGRKEMQLPDGANRPSKPDNTLIKALARAFRWRRMLDNGEVATIADLARLEKIAPSYLSRILRLTFLAPSIIEDILDGRCNTDFSAEALRDSFGDDWVEQRKSLRFR